MSRLWLLPTLAAWIACSTSRPPDGPPAEPPASTPTTPDDPTTGPTTPPPSAFIGSPCSTDADCPYADGICLTEGEGFPGGTCSALCASTCPDAFGYPTTACADPSVLPGEVRTLDDGACLSRCDFGVYPFEGCREGYGCIPSPRPTQPEVELYVCVPSATDALSPCLWELADRGVPFSPTLIADRSPPGHPNLTCHVEEPVVFGSGYEGVDLVFHQGSSPGTVSAGCEMAHALADTLEGVADDGVVVARHLGTVACRTIGDGSVLSQHASGNAIDLSGFDFGDGTAWTYEQHWDHDTDMPEGEAARWLYDTTYGWNEDEVWNVILTPNYNLAHDNHVHADLSPGRDFIGFVGSIVMPNPHGD